MSETKYVDEKDDFFISEGKTSSNIFNLRQDTTLFDDDSYVVMPVISVRYVPSGKTERWEILEDKVVKMILKGTRFSKKEREFLRTAGGMSFMITGFKQGWKYVSEYKRQISEWL